MKRPNKKDYRTTNQFEYNQLLNKYYNALEAYVDVLEKQLNLTDVVVSLPSKEDITSIAEQSLFASDKSTRLFDDDYSKGYEDGAEYMRLKINNKQ
jgi:hypothetical protein